MIRTTTLLCATALTIAANAQSWTVGQPVDMLLYAQPFYGGCSPDPDYTFTLPASPVSGVEYKVIITGLVPATGSMSISPGLDDGLLNDELIIDAEIQRSVTLAPGTTNATLEFRAQGTPTQAGQAHPCSTSQFWMSNLMFCPEGLIPVFNDGCSVVDLSTTVKDAAGESTMTQVPSVANGQQLTIALHSSATAAYGIRDAVGRLVRAGSMGPLAVIDVAALPQGIYVVAVQAEGKTVTKRFLIEHD
ncbi:MAG: T9SS type A sorting domain-containing protein [Flavobacteriales bacterium]|nr:T9SS type A sorting domain-containing protein [Flavobacteriales bacterium]MBP9080484.1 T9SS type A sorting domain-containing protein [Flavobacteriales bacterium]